MADIYVWYSTATDVTGKKLVEALNAKGGTKKPVGNTPILCWGTKIKKEINFGKRKVYNNPNNIKLNRHKFKAMQKMQAEGCNIEKFSTDIADVENGKLKYPVVARTNYHQGGTGFWLCLNKLQLKKAFDEGATYYQQYINIKDEYRLHIVDGKVIYAVKKIARNNHKEAFVNHYSDYINNFAEKNDINVNKDTLKFVLERLARKMATKSDMIIRSNTRGWKFSKLNVAGLNNNLKTEAILAIKALKLDFGAVDCCIDMNGNVYIIEVNTGPGLEGSSFEAWVKALKNLTKVKKVKDVIIEAKKALKDKADIIAKLIDAAEDEEEIKVLNKLWKKI